MLDVPMHHEDPRLFRRRRKDGSLSLVWYGWFYDATGKQVCRSTKRTDRRDFRRSCFGSVCSPPSEGAVPVQ